MSAEELLRTSERSATNIDTDDAQIVSRVVGKEMAGKFLKSKKGMGSLGAVGLVTLLIIVLVIVFSSGNLIPAAISERLVEATDVQYADATESKMLVFQQALDAGSLPENTIKRLKAQGVEVNGSSLVFDGEIISAQDFITKVHNNARLYQAFTAATYDRAAYYYDEAAEEVFKKIGTTRDNYTASSNFDSIMSGLVGEGSNINISNAGLVEKVDSEGKKTTEYEQIGEKANSKEVSAEDFVKTVTENNINENSLLATMDATTALNTADIISKEQKSSIFFAAFMENISKMKAGQGSTSKINEAMNYLFHEEESSVVDTKTGEVIKTKGSMLEAPSLYAVLSGEKINAGDVTNYASDRILKTVENRAGVEKIDEKTREESITSTNTKIRGSIGKLLTGGEEQASFETISPIVPTINSSLVENNFESIGGIYGGEMLVEGAVNVGKMLAKASGGAAGDNNAAKTYASLTSDILALDAEVDRMSRSPLDITSRNTFLGSIVYKLAMGIGKSKVGSVIQNIGSTVGIVLKESFNNLTPSSFADDKTDGYLTYFGDCETISSIGAVGSVTCSEITTFDTSTLNDTFHNDGFINFVEENTELDESGNRTVKKESKLADFIKYNNERITPIGVMDGGILEAVSSGASKISFISNIISMIKAWLGADEEEKNLATGKTFVNSSSNPEWETYKYAQRYVSLARATDALRQYDGDEMAYSDLKYFEGNESPVIAFLNDYYNEIANR